MNTNILATAATLSDASLLQRLDVLAVGTREATAELVAHLSELQVRRSHRGEGPGTLFEYCTQVLKLSEAATFNRLAAASASRKFPVILDLLADGSINLTTVRVLAPHLTIENHRRALEQAIGRSKAEVEEIRARLAPQPDARASIRKLPDPVQPSRPAAAAAAQASDAQATPSPDAKTEPSTTMARPVATQRSAVKPLSPERYRVQFTVGKETKSKLRRVQDLLRREIPDGDPGEIFDRALTLLLAEVQKKAFAETSRPRSPRRAVKAGSRTIQAHVQREVWKRDGGQCAFVGPKGRCTQRSFLEFHHIDPYANGGPATTENISLRCRAHNVYESELVFGGFDPSLVRESAASYGAGDERPSTCPGTGGTARPSAPKAARSWPLRGAGDVGDGRAGFPQP